VSSARLGVGGQVVGRWAAGGGVVVVEERKGRFSRRFSRCNGAREKRAPRSFEVDGKSRINANLIAKMAFEGEVKIEGCTADPRKSRSSPNDYLQAGKIFRLVSVLERPFKAASRVFRPARGSCALASNAVCMQLTSSLRGGCRRGRTAGGNGNVGLVPSRQSRPSTPCTLVRAS
jgi:hypothetical protein